MPSLSFSSLLPSQSAAMNESRKVRLRITTSLTSSRRSPPPTISAPRPTPSTLVEELTSSIDPKGTWMLPWTRTTAGPSCCSASASSSAVVTSMTGPPSPPTAPRGSSSVGTEAKPVASGDQTGPSAVAGPVGTRIRRSRSAAPSAVRSGPRGGGGGAAGGAGGRAAAAPGAAAAKGGGWVGGGGEGSGGDGGRGTEGCGAEAREVAAGDVLHGGVLFCAECGRVQAHGVQSSSPRRYVSRVCSAASSAVSWGRPSTA